MGSLESRFFTNLLFSPKYVQKGKIKFPIDDVLFILYDSILGEHIPKIKVRKFFYLDLVTNNNAFENNLIFWG